MPPWWKFEKLKFQPFHRIIVSCPCKLRCKLQRVVHHSHQAVNSLFHLSVSRSKHVFVLSTSHSPLVSIPSPQFSSCSTPNNTLLHWIAATHPFSLTNMNNNDEYAVLSKDQQSLLNQRKVDMRLENEKYLRNHSELKLMVSVFMRRLLEEKPENPVLFASQFFTRPGLKKDVLSSITRVD